jgi:putative hydrolase of the HAD superfamily
MTVKAVIFDYGMVLSAPPDQVAHANLLEITGMPLEKFEKVYWADRHAYDLGQLNGQTYWEKISKDQGLKLTQEQIDRLIENDVLMWTSINEPMLAWAGQVQDAGIATAILSNMGQEILRYLRQEYAWLGTFQHHTWSCELGIAKPDPEIYVQTCKALAVPPGDSLFLDDKIENVRAAESVGLQAIHFHSIQTLQRDLEERGLAATLPPVVLNV